jgi:hypothetical protein
MDNKDIGKCFFSEFSPKHIADVLSLAAENLYRWDSGQRPKLPIQYREIRDLAHHISAIRDFLNSVSKE